MKSMAATKGSTYDHFDYVAHDIIVSEVDRVERFRLTLRFFDDVSTASLFTFSMPTSTFRRRVGIFSLFFLCCFYFLVKVHVNFFSFL